MPCKGGDYLFFAGITCFTSTRGAESRGISLEIWPQCPAERWSFNVSQKKWTEKGYSSGRLQMTDRPLPSNVTKTLRLSGSFEIGNESIANFSSEKWELFPIETAQKSRWTHRQILKFTPYFTAPSRNVRIFSLLLQEIYHTSLIRTADVMSHKLEYELLKPSVTYFLLKLGREKRIERIYAKRKI